MNVAGTRAACRDRAWRTVGDVERRREIARCEDMIVLLRQLRAL